MRYRVRMDPRALRDLAELPPVVRKRLAARIDTLADDPRPRSSIHLGGDLRGEFRLRIGDYRASYSISDRDQLVRVWAVGHRSRFYDEAGRRRR